MAKKYLGDIMPRIKCKEPKHLPYGSYKSKGICDCEWHSCWFNVINKKKVRGEIKREIRKELLYIHSI